MSRFHVACYHSVAGLFSKHFICLSRGNKELEEVKMSLGNLLKELEQIRATLTVHIDVRTINFVLILKLKSRHCSLICSILMLLVFAIFDRFCVS